VKKTLCAIALLCLLRLDSAIAETPNSGAVSEGEQYWKGKKVFDENVPNVAELTGNVTLTKASKFVQVLDPGGAHRNVTLPDVAASKGYVFTFVNTANAAENLVIKNAGASTIVTIGQNQSGWAFSNGLTWYGAAFTSAATGLLAADGTVEGATAQAQVFTTGVDVNGGADAIILDADGNTTISAPTDNQIDIEVNNADDFTFTANTFTALSGSTIKTDTIAETTGAAGVTIDGVLVKDGGATLTATLLGDGQPQYKEVSITNAEMLDLADTPVTLIAAPGDGKVIEIEAVSFFFDYTAAYTVTANDDLDVCYTNESNVILTAEATNFVDATADTCLFATRVANYAPAKTVANNAAVVLANNSSDFGGGDAGNAVKVKIRYRIWTVGW
jgi:hypothetical protein